MNCEARTRGGWCNNSLHPSQRKYTAAKPAAVENLVANSPIPARRVVGWAKMRGDEFQAARAVGAG